ncbi:MAG TPA: hypothetical protein ACFYD4_10065 [Candidatus Wunengus sp. YC61]|uniref:hypothetical protein n=1 Tax=Candidatus Wunengus sp. YC61 TaxID=3367698 RepID=UPI004028989F
MTLTEALDSIYGHGDWNNPIHPYFVSGASQTPYGAYRKLKTPYQEIVCRLIGHLPGRDDV